MDKSSRRCTVNIQLRRRSDVELIPLLPVKVSLSDFMTLSLARTGSKLFVHSRPSLVLLIAACIAVAISTVLAWTWPFPNTAPHSGDKITGVTIGFIWIYCLCCFLIQDGTPASCHLPLMTHILIDTYSIA